MKMSQLLNKCRPLFFLPVSTALAIVNFSDGIMDHGSWAWVLGLRMNLWQRTSPALSLLRRLPFSDCL